MDKCREKKTKQKPARDDATDLARERVEVGEGRVADAARERRVERRRGEQRGGRAHGAAYGEGRWHILSPAAHCKHDIAHWAGM